jgi:hypothetical protein
VGGSVATDLAIAEAKGPLGPVRLAEQVCAHTGLLCDVADCLRFAVISFFNRVVQKLQFLNNFR